jgi:hypothetical protein
VKPQNVRKELMMAARKRPDNQDDFWDQVTIMVPCGFPAAAQVAAHRRKMTTPEYCRQMLLRALEADGVRLPQEVAA